MPVGCFFNGVAFWIVSEKAKVLKIIFNYLLLWVYRASHFFQVLEVVVLGEIWKAFDIFGCLNDGRFLSLSRLSHPIKNIINLRSTIQIKVWIKRGKLKFVFKCI